jgi:hypothetical protein
MSDRAEEMELDPKRLRFGISKAERKELERKVRKRKSKKKLNIH